MLVLLAALAAPAAAAAKPRRLTAKLVTRTAASALRHDRIAVRLRPRHTVRVRVRVRGLTKARKVRLRARRARRVRLRLTARGERVLRRCRGRRRLTVVVARRNHRSVRRQASLRCRRPAPPREGPVGGEPSWPSMRHDTRNTGATGIAAAYAPGARPWTFATAKGIFSTPVIGGDGTAYVGSADTTFYALDGAGKPRWSFPTGGIIDAAGAIDGDTVVMGSGDEHLYRLGLGDGKPRWSFKATTKPATGQLVNWWEGNVARGPDGDVYAGNTGGGAYRLSPDGRQRWVYQAGNSVWTTPAFGPDGTTYWGSLDLTVFALDRDGKKRWSTTTPGYVVSSPALSSDGKTLYVGSFDGRLYALDSATGAPRWTFQTRDHIYSSPALEEDAGGRVTSIYVASTDGSIYALRADGSERWRYDTGDPVRSSPALGRAPAGEPAGRRILYAGSADGSLYAIDTDTGTRRWSYDTTPDDPALRDRNDLNGSPALGPQGVVIGGEHGAVTFVPYDYCLHAVDARCTVAPGQPFGDELTRILAVTSGGGTRVDRLDLPQSTAVSLAARLLVRRGGRTVDAGLQSPAVTTEPPFPFSTQLSGDGRHLFVVPDGFLEPGTDYRVAIDGAYTGEGARPAGGQAGATTGGTVHDGFAFRTAGPGAGRLPLAARADDVDALRIRRLAVPLPAFLTSVNQIGFDFYDLIAGTLEVRDGRVLLWVVGGRRGPDGTEVADPKAGFGFPIAGSTRGDSFILARRDLNLTFSFGEVPARRFELRGQLDPGLRVRPGANLYAEVFCPDVPNYGPQLLAIGLCNPSGVLPVGGTFLTDRYDARGGASRRPAGLSAGDVRLTRPTTAQDGEAVADLALAPGAHYRAADHVLSIVLADADTLEPVTVDYVKATSVEAGAGGDARHVRVALPRGMQLPARVRAYVVADAFPVAVRDLP